MYVYQDHIFYPHAPVSSQIFPTSAIQKCGITPCPCPCGISNQQHPGLISSSWFPLKKRAFSLILEAEEKNHISAAFSCHIKIFSNHLQPSSTPFSSPFPPPQKKNAALPSDLLATSPRCSAAFSKALVSWSRTAMCASTPRRESLSRPFFFGRV